MFRILIISFSFLFTACSSAVLPNKTRDLSEFIPRDEVTEKQTLTLVDFNFTEENFPNKCEWKSLTRVIDGDTIIVDSDLRIRLIGIDTPEIKHPTKPIQKFGLESSDFTINFFQNVEKVCLIQDPIGDKIDKYGRTLAYVFREDGAELSVEVLKSGLARGYFSFPFSRKDEFQFLENMAKKKKVNLWK